MNVLSVCPLLQVSFTVRFFPFFVRSSIYCSILCIVGTSFFTLIKLSDFFADFQYIHNSRRYIIKCYSFIFVQSSSWGLPTVVLSPSSTGRTKKCCSHSRWKYRLENLAVFCLSLRKSTFSSSALRKSHYSPLRKSTAQATPAQVEKSVSGCPKFLRVWRRRRKSEWNLQNSTKEAESRGSSRTRWSVSREVTLFWETSRNISREEGPIREDETAYCRHSTR